jgi:hypothetical protein
MVLVRTSVADPHHFDADPCFQIKAQNLDKVLKHRLIFRKFWLVIRKLFRIRIQLHITLMRIRIHLITLMRIRIQLTTLMPIRIRIQLSL